MPSLPDDLLKDPVPAGDLPSWQTVRAAEDDPDARTQAVRRHTSMELLLEHVPLDWIQFGDCCPSPYTQRPCVDAAYREQINFFN